MSLSNSPTALRALARSSLPRYEGATRAEWARVPRAEGVVRPEVVGDAVCRAACAHNARARGEAAPAQPASAKGSQSRQQGRGVRPPSCHSRRRDAPLTPARRCCTPCKVACRGARACATAPASAPRSPSPARASHLPRPWRRTLVTSPTPPPTTTRSCYPEYVRLGRRKLGRKHGISAHLLPGGWCASGARRASAARRSRAPAAPSAARSPPRPAPPGSWRRHRAHTRAPPPARPHNLPSRVLAARVDSTHGTAESSGPQRPFGGGDRNDDVASTSTTTIYDGEAHPAARGDGAVDRRGKIGVGEQRRGEGEAGGEGRVHHGPPQRPLVAARRNRGQDLLRAGEGAPLQRLYRLAIQAARRLRGAAQRVSRTRAGDGESAASCAQLLTAAGEVMAAASIDPQPYWHRAVAAVAPEVVSKQAASR
eukprot:scaffold2739_cov301-Prasinococcus_capsulatus_cf.AAC.3